MRDDFAIFISSYNNPNDIKTLNSLKNTDYDGDYYIVVDDKDPQLEIYKEKFKEKLLTYNKKEQAKYYDIGFNKPLYNNFINSANFIHYIAKKMNYKYYYLIEDDYNGYDFRYNSNNTCLRKRITYFNPLIDCMIDFLNCNDNIYSVGFGTQISYMNGNKKILNELISYRIFNGWFCDTEKEINFNGLSDHIWSTYNNNIGKLFLSYLGVEVLHVLKSNIEKEKINNDYLLAFVFLPNLIDLFISNYNFKIKKKSKDFCVPKIIDERWKNER